MAVALVEVGHRRHEPSVNGLLHVHLAGVWVEHRCQLIAGLQVFVVHLSRTVYSLRFLVVCLILRTQPFRIVEPVGRRHVHHPGMLESAVVENHVHHHLQSLFMSVGNEPAVVFVGSEPWVHLIVVCRGISVVCALFAVVGRVVLKHRSEPQCRYSQLVEIVQMLANALQVAAMTEARFVAVD